MEDYKPHIGKNVIETLTLGMYENAHFIYREYVQNAADQIDVAVEEGILDRKNDGRIDISIDKVNKVISIKDNATGIQSSEVLRFLGDVANSQKDRTKRKGFRGIGRLGGLGYCDTLIFETSYKGENIKSIITLNARLLRKIIDDRADTRDASAVISAITLLEKSKEDSERHYFKVKMNNVTNDALLDEVSVKNYLSMVAPVPFGKDFPLSKKVHTYFNKNNVKIEEYDVHLRLNSEKLFKAYKMDIFDKKGNPNPDSKISDVNFFDIRNSEEELIALGWYGISGGLNNQIPSNNIERGLRLRKDNIGIGSETTLSKFYGQSRQNLNYIGEIYALGTQFIPNARRDYFNDNKICQIFEKELKKFLPTLGSLTQKSSDLHNRKKDILNYKEELKTFNKKIENKELTDRQKESQKSELKKHEKKAYSAQKIIDKIQQRSINDSNLKVIYQNIIGDTNINLKEENNFVNTKGGTYQITLSRLKEREKKIVHEIFSILEQNLPLEEAEMLKKKIAEHYN